ncbi:MAG: hypothetical protein AB8G14_10980 [Ilumatobacter sp.]
MAGRKLALVAQPPLVAVCVGKDCRKQDGYDKLRTELDARCDVVDLKCIGVCSGPVVAVAHRGSAPSVYSKLRSKPQRRLLMSLLAGDAAARRDLSKRRVLKKKAINQALRQLKRRTVVDKRAA